MSRMLQDSALKREGDVFSDISGRVVTSTELNASSASRHRFQPKNVLQHCDCWFNNWTEGQDKLTCYDERRRT
jgi:hypothetical protein